MYKVLKSGLIHRNKFLSPSVKKLSSSTSFEPNNTHWKNLCVANLYNNKSRILPILLKSRSHIRLYSDISRSDDKNKRSLPRLSDYSEIIWPSLILTVKNWILTTFIIRPYLDKEFYVKDFIYGAKQAMQVISSKLAEGDISSLKGLVEGSTLAKVAPIVSTMSVSQRQELAVKQNDIFLCFPYQIGILFGADDEKTQKRWVEITMVFHVLKGLQELRNSDVEIQWNMGISPEYQNKVCICNYRFIKEYTKGIESDWTVNQINHFKPADLLKEN